MAATEPIDLAVILEMPAVSLAHYTERYKVHYWPDPADHPRLPRDVRWRKRIRAVQTNGSFGIKRSHIEAMPALEIICIVGAGFEGVDLAAARERGIVVTYGVGRQRAGGGRAGVGASARRGARGAR